MVMPNLTPPITGIALANAYRDRILQSRPKGSDFEPLMTVYLTDNTDPSEIERGFAAKAFVAAKLYPAHATTNSDLGVTDILRISSVLERMQKIGMPLLVHGESTRTDVDVFDREEVFIDETLTVIRRQFPDLKIVFEHITTQQAVEFVLANKSHVAATITAHHLIINRNAMFQGGLRPHYYCLPVAKREQHRIALRRAATGGENCFFLGTDSAPHTIAKKESACGCAGIFSAPTALELYAQVFADEGALENFEGFSSMNGPKFYGLPVNSNFIELQKQRWQPPEKVGGYLTFQTETPLEWKIISS